MKKDLPDQAIELLGIDEDSFFQEAFAFYHGRHSPYQTAARIAYYQKQSDGIWPMACLSYAERVVTYRKPNTGLRSVA